MKYIKTNMGLIPIGDYQEITAMQYGFNSYEDMKSKGMDIQIDNNDIVEKNS